MTPNDPVKGKKGAPAGKWVLTPEVLLTRLHELSDDLLLSPSQAAIVLQVDPDWLRKQRQQQGTADDGISPLPYLKLGDGKNAAVRYRLGDLRKRLESGMIINTHGAKIATFASFADFMSRGLNDDAWLFALPTNSRPIDFFAALAAGIDFEDCEWMTMAAYLDVLPGAIANDEARALGSDDNNLPRATPPVV